MPLPPSSHFSPPRGPISCASKFSLMSRTPKPHLIHPVIVPSLYHRTCRASGKRWSASTLVSSSSIPSSTCSHMTSAGLTRVLGVCLPSSISISLHATLPACLFATVQPKAVMPDPLPSNAPSVSSRSPSAVCCSHLTPCLLIVSCWLTPRVARRPSLLRSVCTFRADHTIPGLLASRLRGPSR